MWSKDRISKDNVPLLFFMALMVLPSLDDPACTQMPGSLAITDGNSAIGIGSGDVIDSGLTITSVKRYRSMLESSASSTSRNLFKYSQQYRSCWMIVFIVLMMKNL